MKKLLLILIISSLGTIAISQNLSYQQKLYYSCKVWGFVKYYHSKVSNCEVNWDSVLVSTLPLIKNSVTKNDFNDALDTMLLAAGPMAISTTPFPDTLPPELKRNRNFTWINDTVFRPDIKVILDTIKNNFRPHAICWVKDNDYSTSYQGWLIFPYDSLMLNDNAHTNFPDEFTRLKLIFKYWNIINYFNPYNYVQDSTWDNTLYKNILAIANDTNYQDFFTSLKKITAHMDDAHVEGWTSSSAFNLFGNYCPNIILRNYQNNYIVVKSNYLAISKGDVIISVDGKTPTQWEDSLKQYVSAGNISVFKSYMCQYMLSGGYNAQIKIIYKDSLGNNQTFTHNRTSYVYGTWFSDYYPNDSLKTVKWMKWNTCNIGYVNMGNLQSADVSTMYAALKNTSSIIFDLRNYPNGAAWDIANLMYPNSICFSKILEPDVTYPGTYYWYYDKLGYNGNPNNYTGHIIILFNEETGSQAEYSCMILKAMPNVTTVGSQTVGTDGNVSYFYLSQDILTGFTTLGIFYPNGDSTERIGIVPDSIVYPTALGIRHGKDEVLEKALKIANCYLSIPVFNNESPFELIVFPNPASDNLTIETPKQSTIEILNIQGQLLKTFAATENKTSIDVSSFPSGVYVVEVKTEKGVEVRKFIKE